MQNKMTFPVRIDRGEVLRYLGYGTATPDEQVARQLDLAIDTIQEIAAPSLVCRTFEIESITPDANASAPGMAVSADTAESAPLPLVRLKNTTLTIPGRTAALMLKECSHCVLLAATVGRGIDARLRRLQVRNMADALILDSAASNAVESLCEQLTELLEEENEAEGRYITDRFSPGYGDIPLAIQPEIIRTLNAEKTIGLSVTSSMLMVPTKSVTAVIGIADAPQPRRITGCAHCRMNKTCKFRKEGTSCAQ